MRTCFICAVKNEAAVFKLRDDLTFAKAVEVAQEIEEAAKVAKETVHGSLDTPSTTTPVLRVEDKRKPPPEAKGPVKHRGQALAQLLRKGACMRCGRKNHLSKECRFIEAICRFCQKKGHLEAVCLKKQRSRESLT